MSVGAKPARRRWGARAGHAEYLRGHAVDWLTARVNLAPRQLTARVVDRHATASTGEPIDGCGMALRLLDCFQAIVLHSGFLNRLNKGQVRLIATLGAAKGLAAIVDFLKATDAQRGIASAYVAAQPHRAERLAQSAEGIGLMGPGFGHDRR